MWSDSKCHSPGNSGILWQQQQQQQHKQRLIIIIDKTEYTSGKIWVIHSYFTT